MVDKFKDLLASLAIKLSFLVIVLAIFIGYLLNKVLDLKSTIAGLLFRKNIDKKLDVLKGLDDESNKTEDEYNRAKSDYLKHLRDS